MDLTARMEAHPPAKRQRVVSRRAAEAAAAAAHASKNHTPKNHTTHKQRPRLGGSTPAEKARLAGSRLKLPLPVQLATAEGVKHGLLIGGNWESEKLRLQFEGRVLTPSKAAKVAIGTGSEVNGLLMWKWSPKPGEYHSLYDLRAAGVVLENDSETGAAQELVVLAALGKQKKQPPPAVATYRLAGLRLQLPLPLQIATAEGAKNGLLVGGNWEGAPPLQVQFEGQVMAPSKAAKLATGKDSEVNGLLMWKWMPNPDESYSLHTLRAAGVTLESTPSPTEAAEELATLAEASSTQPLAEKKKRKEETICLEGLRLQLPLPLQIATAEGAKNGLLVGGNWEGAPPLQVQFEGKVMAPSKAAKRATGKDSEVNGLLMWKWIPNPDEGYSLRYCHSLHNLRAAGVTLEPQPSSHHIESSAVEVCG